MVALSTPVSAGSIVQAPHASAVGWGAIVAGAVGSVTTHIVLLTLGAGIGLTAISPWSGEGMTAKAIGVSAVIWMVVVQWLSAGMGGYLAGRLRLRWNYFDNDEVFFRDTTHGFLSWGLALVITVAVATSLVAGAARTASMAGAVAAGSQARNSSLGYYTDSLFRTETPADTATAAATSSNPAASNMEATRILTEGLAGDFAPDDRAYLAKLVSQRTGLTPDEAQKRVDAVIAKAKDAADKARKAAAALAIATALSLAVGAFISAVAAGFGGRLRDE